jgi:acetyl esterase/lipase
MPSKAFLAYQQNIPTAPPTMDVPGGAAIPPEYADLGIPMVPPDYVPPEPEIPQGYQGGKVTVNGVDGLHLTRAGVREKCALMYLHGGGFTIGSAMNAGDILAHFIDETRLEGFAVEYSLAPYAKFPVPVNQCVDFYKGLLDQGYEKIVIGGESAGAGLTISVTHAIRSAGLPQPAALWCSSPVDNIRFDLEEIWRQDMFTSTSAGLQKAYAGDADPKDPGLSPIYGDFSNFPPMFIQAGSAESLSAGAIRLVTATAKAGSEVLLHFGRDMPHTFAMDYKLYPEAANAMREFTTFVNNVLDLE